MILGINGRFLVQDVTGVQRVAIEFTKALDELLSSGEYPGLKVTLWVPLRGRLVTVLPLKSIQIRRAGRLSGHLWEQLELPRLAGEASLICLGNTSPMVRLILRRRTTYTVIHDLSYKYHHSAYSRSFRLLYNLIVPMVLKRAGHVFTVSASEEASILRHYPRAISRRRLSSVQNGGGDAAVGAQVSSAIDSLCIGSTQMPDLELRSGMCLYVGSLTKRKNCDGLTRAALQVVDKFDIKFVFVGATNSSFDAVALEIPDRVRDDIVLLGQVNDPDRIEELYRRANVFVFPSYYEASPLPPVEAMSFGTPVVCSDIPSLRERCGDAVLYCDPASVDSIVTQVSRLLGDEHLWHDMQRRGLAQAANFTWKRQVRSVLDVLIKKR